MRQESLLPVNTCCGRGRCRPRTANLQQMQRRSARRRRRCRGRCERMRSLLFFVGDYGDIVEPGPLFLRRKAEEAWRTLLMGGLVRDFDRPRLRLRFALLVSLRAYHTGAVLCHINAGLEMVPFIRRPFKRNALSEQFLV